MRLAGAGAKITRNASSQIKGTIPTVPNASGENFTIEIDCTEVTRNARVTAGNGTFHSATRTFVEEERSTFEMEYFVLPRPLAGCGHFYQFYSAEKFNFGDLLNRIFLKNIERSIPGNFGIFRTISRGIQVINNSKSEPFSCCAPV